MKSILLMLLVGTISWSAVVADEPHAGPTESKSGWVKHPRNPVLGGDLGTCFEVIESPRADLAPSASEPPALRPLTFEPLPLGSVRPEGWLKRQLKIQAAGLSGHLDEIWPDLKDSAWTGGKAEGWERAPYWLDGIVPLAFLIDDDALKAKARRFIDYVLDHQHADGWLGPISDGKHEAYDPWPLFIVFKAFTQYQEATGDPRIVPALLEVRSQDRRGHDQDRRSRAGLTFARPTWR